VTLVFEIKSSVWHQFVKEELNLLLRNSRIFCCQKSLFKTWKVEERERGSAPDGVREAGSKKTFKKNKKQNKKTKYFIYVLNSFRKNHI